MGVATYRDARVRTHPDVYEPSDDTPLLADAVLDRPPGRLLEVGTGTGLVAILAARAGHGVVATDVTAEAVRLARDNVRGAGVDPTVDVVRADLLAGLDVAAFDLVAFNPPYLPTTDETRVPGPLDRAFDGGPTGIEVASAFVDQLPADGPPALLVVSSRQDLAALADRLGERGWERAVVAERRVPGFERLAVWRVG